MARITGHSQTVLTVFTFPKFLESERVQLMSPSLVLMKLLSLVIP